MNRRLLLSSFLAAVCLATLWGVWSQRAQVAELRAEQQQLTARVAAKADGPAAPVSAETVGAASGTGEPALVATPELLRLRSEVTRLTERRRELASVRGENERLRAQAAARGTNGPGGVQLPPGYITKREARMVGYNTPEDTLQSLLWAMHNHDLTNVLQALAPEQAEQLRAHAGESREASEDFFRTTAGFVGMRVVKREQEASDGSLTLELEVIPGMRGPRIKFRQINGQWKVAEPL
jgi:hypothetical protein